MSDRLRLFEQDQARAWVAAHQGRWDHGQWLALLDELRRGGWHDLDPNAIGAVLERKKLQYWNLRHCDERGEPWRWVVSRAGKWAHHEWMTLLAGLQCWLGPIDADALGELLEHYGRVYRDWQRWIATGMARRWVDAREGHWGHDQWLGFVAVVRVSGFLDLPADLIGQTLEECKAAYWRLRHWESSAEPYRWVEARRGRWNDAEWRRLLESLERSQFWPMAVEDVAAIIERARKRYESLNNWRRSGAALAWVAERRGQWETGEWLELLASLQASEPDEVEPMALSELLEDLREQYVNLQAWLERRSAAEERILFPAEASLRRAA